jgi:hypothetical protein
VYEQAFKLYQAGRFNDAEQLFTRLSTSDRPSAVLAGRCVEFQKHSPSNWRGVFMMTSK